MQQAKRFMGNSEEHQDPRGCLGPAQACGQEWDVPNLSSDVFVLLSPPTLCDPAFFYIYILGNPDMRRLNSKSEKIYPTFCRRVARRGVSPERSAQLNMDAVLGCAGGEVVIDRAGYCLRQESLRPNPRPAWTTKSWQRWTVCQGRTCPASARTSLRFLPSMHGAAHR
ncbi:hypothetical protein GN956_G18875 [Arapaima gigas]